MSDSIYTVRQFNQEVRELIETSYKQIWVEGEISNLASPSSGHMYFTLKEKDAQVRCAFFRNRRLKISFDLKNGQAVHLKGRPSLYEARGEFQILVDYLEPAGEGLLRRKFEQLKNHLRQEGLFDISHKRRLPDMPGCIGIITSISGAAIQDILSTLKRRYPVADILIYPAAVQGERAVPEIVRALSQANEMRACDVILLARGGGSLEDLWAFNEEVIVRAIYSSHIPVVTGIGHEVDLTLSDLSADHRAATPTAAAESASPDRIEIINTIASTYRRLKIGLDHSLRSNSQHVDILMSRLRHPVDLLHTHGTQLLNLQTRLMFAWKTTMYTNEMSTLRLCQKLDNMSPKLLIDRNQFLLNSLNKRLARVTNALSTESARKLSSLTARFQALSPKHTLQRGYSILRDPSDGRLLPNVGSIRKGQTLEAEMTDGWVECIVKNANRYHPRATAIRDSKQTRTKSK